MTVQNLQTSENPALDANQSEKDRLRELMRTVHDLGGRGGGAIDLQERDQSDWEKSTFALCECLAWRGIWNTVEKHRRHADLGQTQYLGLPYYGRWLVSAAKGAHYSDRAYRQDQ